MYENGRTVQPAKDVIPAQAGIQFTPGWMPAFAGMTVGYVLFSE